MISLLGGAQSTPAEFFLNPPNPSSSGTSFAAQLGAAIEQYLSQAANGGPVEIQIQPQTSQSSGGGQFLVTVKTNPAPLGAPPQQTPAGNGTNGGATPPSSSAGTPPSSSTGTPGTQAPTGSTPGAGSAADPPPGYQNVPFGISMTTVPTLQTILARQHAMMAVMSPEAILNQDKVSAEGDPMRGHQIEGTNLNWDDLTQDQQLAYIYSMNYGRPAGESMQAYLEANVGPKIMANAPSLNPTMFGHA